jgi:hypothetical protein
MATYAPIKIKNPTSPYHVAILKPSQEMILMLDGDREDDELFFSNDDWLSWNFSKGKYHIRPVGVTRWEEYSHVLLGEIVIDAPQKLSKVLVVLECSNAHKKDQMTIINPTAYDVRVKPHYVMEFILFEESLGKDCKWTWNFETHERFSMGVDLLGSASVARNVCWEEEDPEYRYAALVRGKWSRNTNQRHFWFRFDEKIYSALSFGKTSYMGTFHFAGISGSNHILRSARIHVDLGANMKHLWSVQKTQQYKKLGDYSNYNWKNHHVSSKPIHLMRVVKIKKMSSVSVKQGCRVIET